MIAIARLLNWQGIVGLSAALALAVLLVVQKGETRHFRKESARFEQLYRDGEASRAKLVADLAQAADRARADDRANTARVARSQEAINHRSLNDYEARISDARARAERLRQPPADQDRRPSGGAPVPGLSAPSGRPPQGARQDRLPPEDALIATEQAIQLDELITWIRAQSAVDPNQGPPPPGN